RSETSVNEATAAKAPAEQALKEAEERAAAARQVKTDKEAEVADASKAFKELESTRKAAADAVKIWNRRLEPISVFISGKTNGLEVGEGYTRVFDGPVTIRDPQKRLGTHLYMAMPPQEQATGQDASALRWIVMSIPDSSAADDQDESRRRRKKKYDEDR